MTNRTTASLRKIDDHVAVRLRAARNLKGLSQIEASEPLGVTFQQLQKYENGTNRITSAKLAVMGQTYGVGIDWFFDGAPGLNGNKQPTTDWGARLMRLPDGPELAGALCGLTRNQRDLILRLAAELA